MRRSSCTCAWNGELFMLCACEHVARAILPRGTADIYTYPWRTNKNVCTRLLRFILEEFLKSGEYTVVAS